MKKIGITVLLLMAAMLLAVGTASAAAPKGNRGSKASAHAAADHPHARTFVVRLSGAQEVPPRDTDARGIAVFHVNREGTEVRYRVIAHNIEDVQAGHIHTGTLGVNGPVVVSLYSPTACRTTEHTVMCQGTFNASNLTGPLAGHPLSDLLVLMREGRAYVNLHTVRNPGGEIRGQFGLHRKQ